ncbi:MAG: ubiquinol-cytochrome C chaperone family protein [Magnetococcales bacterium]|nr:ubiquinol-cytochrome C chaperone family protein [Magnetococcales bacterium]
MSWFNRISPKKQPESISGRGISPRSGHEEGGAKPLSREQVLAIHGQVVDRVLQITGAGLGIEDNFSLRFDVMIYFISALLRHLHAAGRSHAATAQLLWDITFEGLEESLRDRGVTDIRMASRMRTLLQDATGRRNAYLAAWEQTERPEAIRVVMARNIFNGADATDPRIDALQAQLPAFVLAVLNPYVLLATTVENGAII